MPSHAASFELRTRAVWPMAMLFTWVTLFGCRDTREDANYCSNCGPNDAGATKQGMSAAMASDGSGSAQAEGSGVRANPPSGGSTSTASGTPAMSTTPNMSMAGQAGSGTRPAASSGGRAAPAAGTPATAADGGSDPQTPSGGSGSSAPRDAGTSEQDPDTEPPRDAGSTAPPVPCGGQCPPQTPVCDETRSQCVQCTAQNQLACIAPTATCDVAQNKCVECTPDNPRECDPETPVCNRNNRCVRCTNDLPNSCPEAENICDNEMRCVECQPGGFNTCPMERGLCRQDGKCVTCMEDANCDATRPVCDRNTNACIGCRGPSDCGTRFPLTPFCDKDIQQCVACSPSESQCGVGSFCDATTYACLPDIPLRGACQPCAADNECGKSQSISACIEQGGAKSCFIAVARSNGVCEPGYEPQPVPGRPPELSYCMPSAASSCPALTNAVLGTACTSDAECGRNGKCLEGTCTVSCVVSQDCPSPLSCNAAFCKR
jgi:hypothetical protein